MRVHTNQYQKGTIYVGSVGVMEAVYYEASKPGSYGGIRPIKQYSGSPIKTVTNWLSSQNTYTLHKPIRKIFPRRKTFAKGINHLFQADQVKMQSMSRGNDGNRSILICWTSIQNMVRQKGPDS